MLHRLDIYPHRLHNLSFLLSSYMSFPMDNKYLDNARPPHIDIVNSDATSNITSSSYYSANHTEPNLVGTGRVLGNAYDYVGRRVEKTVGVVAQKIGFRPRSDVIYQEIKELYQAGWASDERKSRFLSVSSPVR